MIKPKTLAVSAILAASFGLSTAALMVAFMNKPPAESTTTLDTAPKATVGGATADPAKGDRVVPLAPALAGGNTTLGWTCSKSFPTGSRETHTGRWGKFAGAVAYNGKAQTMLGIEATLAADSFQSDAPALTRTLVETEKWFDVKAHPKATFSAGEFAARSPETEKALAADAPAVEGWTHLVKGTLDLNGVKQPVSFPAKITFSGETLRLEASFILSRKAFKVEKREASVLGTVGGTVTVVDDRVLLSLGVVASPDTSVLIAELAGKFDAQQAAGAKLADRLADAEKRLAAADALAEKVAAMKSEIQMLQQSGGGAGAPAELPAKFTDKLVYAPWEADIIKDGKKEHQTFEGKSAEFNMVLVPGDKAKGIAPFYMSETEVTWDVFYAYAACQDLPGEVADKQKADALRPTPCYGDFSREMGFDGRPAVGMSRLNAEKFCQFLSDKTGRRYRLPTEAEWDLAYALGGGDPADVDAAAWNAENAMDNETLFAPRVGLVAKKQANKLGLYDMLGNTSEWVNTGPIGGVHQDSTMGDGTVVRGGSFQTPKAQLKGALRDEAKQSEWNATYPNTPKSRWWYKDRFEMGIRLVCDPVNLPKK